MPLFVYIKSPCLNQFILVKLVRQKVELSALFKCRNTFNESCISRGSNHNNCLSTGAPLPSLYLYLSAPSVVLFLSAAQMMIVAETRFAVRLTAAGLLNAGLRQPQEECKYMYL